MSTVRERSLTGRDDPRAGVHRLEVVVAGCLVLLLGARLYVAYELSLAVLVGLMLTPIWWRRVSVFAGGRPLLLAIAVAMVSGVWLADMSASDHEVISRQLLLNAALVLSLGVGLGIIMWARSLMSDLTVALLFGAGMILAIRPNAGILENPWKFGFDKPVSLAVLAIACSVRGRLAQPLALLSLAALGAASGARSRSAILLVVLVACAWQALPKPKSARASTARFAVAGLGMGVAVYQFGQAVLLEGALGEAAQQRTQEQIQRSGSLIVGGRPEIAATWALMRERFEGFGFGVAVNQHDLDTAKIGMLNINYDPDNGYVNNFMFGNGIELHSGFGDLWAFMGVPGLVMAGAIISIVAVRLSRLVATRSANAVVLMLGLTIAWDMAFSPLKTSLPYLTIGVALLLARRFPSQALGKSTSTLGGFDRK